MKPLVRSLAALAAFLLVTACSTIDRSEAPAVSGKALWVVLPFANHTETPLAASRAEAIAEGVLRAQGIAKLRRYPAALQTEALFEASDRRQLEAGLEWARSEGARYALTGSVAIAILLQGLIFGLFHAYQGTKNVIVICLLGLLYGALAEWRKNLRANIIAHGWSDIWEGWLKFLLWS